jgi:hypothetical protein
VQIQSGLTPNIRDRRPLLDGLVEREFTLTLNIVEAKGTFGIYNAKTESATSQIQKPENEELS